MFLFLEKYKSLLSNPIINIIYNALRIVGALSFIATSLGFFLYSLGYSFLFGYYFSGGVEGQVSLLRLLTNPVPFHKVSLLSVCVFLVLSIGFLVSIIFSLRNSNLKRLPIILTVLFLFHICLTLFFIGGAGSLNNAILFLVIWSLPLFITILIFFTIRGISSLFATLSGVVFGICLLVIVETIFKIDISEKGSNWLLFEFVLFGSGIVFSYFKPEKNYTLASIFFPYIFLSTIFLGVLVQKLIGQPIFIKVWSIVLIAILIDISVLKLLDKKDTWKTKVVSFIRVDWRSSSKQEVPIQEIKKYKAIFTSLFFILLLTAGVFSIQASLIAGQYVRSFTPEHLLVRDEINDMTNKKNYIGVIVTEKDSNLFISDENWELAVVRSDSVTVRVYHP
ncbi:hypothetical protein ABE504_08630 [Paenibacillus oryzisoli]|uniref:hypothetical protein n=1 Tax=Paenibacillus oryzisoli TaxID=1850517 RepID=UPI003D2A7EBE